MNIVKTQCKSQVWDSTFAIMYRVGDEVEIDLDDPHGLVLASMTIGNPTDGKRKQYCFEFDRLKLARPKVQSISEGAGA